MGRPRHVDRPRLRGAVRRGPGRLGAHVVIEERAPAARREVREERHLLVRHAQRLDVVGHAPRRSRVRERGHRIGGEGDRAAALALDPRHEQARRVTVESARRCRGSAARPVTTA